MVDFADLGEAGAGESGDEVAIARGNQTLRQTVDRLLEGVGISVYVAAVDSLTPSASDFTSLTKRPVLLTLATGQHAAFAYRASLGIRPVILLDGARYKGAITESAAPITKNSESLDYSVITRSGRPGTYLFAWEFAETLA